ncbi:MAG: FHA domain-containing protein, partial [Gammaproteobacteria bacterium]
ALTGATTEGIVFSEPGAVQLGNGLLFGTAALGTARLQPRQFNDRFWSELSDKPLVTPKDNLESFADLVHYQLKHHIWEPWSADIERVAFAVPSVWNNEQLGLLLGISEEIGIPLTGITRLPIAATRRPYPDQELLHLEAGLHATGINRMSAGESAVDAEPELISDLGLASLRDVVLKYFCRCFLDSSRFDPLQSAESEQEVFNRLGEWLNLLNKRESAELQFNWRDNTYRAKPDVAGLTEAIRKTCQPLIQALRTIVSIDSPTALQVDARLAEIPGVVDLLLELPGCDVFVLEPGAAARGLVARQDCFKANNGNYSLTGSLPLDQEAVAASAQSAAAPAVQIPTHLLYGGVAYRIASEPFRIGAEVPKSDYGVSLSSRHSGVSRQHCSIELADGRVRLNDHSRYGTLLNGRKIDSSAVLQPGDTVTVGQPGCDFHLITEHGPDGA